MAQTSGKQGLEGQVDILLSLRCWGLRSWLLPASRPPHVGTCRTLRGTCRWCCSVLFHLMTPAPPSSATAASHAATSSRRKDMGPCLSAFTHSTSLSWVLRGQLIEGHLGDDCFFVFWNSHYFQPRPWAPWRLHCRSLTLRGLGIWLMLLHSVLWPEPFWDTASRRELRSAPLCLSSEA